MVPDDQPGDAAGSQAALPLETGESSIYATLCAALNDELNPDEIVPLPFSDGRSLGHTKAHLQHAWHALAHPGQARDEASEAAWLAEFVARILADGVGVLCTTMRLADCLGVDALQKVLAQALADACGTAEGVASALGEPGEPGAEDEELVGCIAELAAGRSSGRGAPSCWRPWRPGSEQRRASTRTSWPRSPRSSWSCRASSCRHVASR